METLETLDTAQRVEVDARKIHTDAPAGNAAVAEYLKLYNAYWGGYDGARELLDMMKTHGFFIAPASAKYHGARPGGLVAHTNAVVRNVMALASGNFPQFADGRMDVVDAVRAALIHDICKLDLYQPGTKNVKDPNTGKWESVPCYLHNDGRLMGHGEESVILAMKYIPNMPPRVMLAVRWHMGAYKDPDKISQMTKDFDRCPEALAVHLADMMAAHDTEADT